MTACWGDLPFSGPTRRCVGCGELFTTLDPRGLCTGCAAELTELLDAVAADEEREFANNEAERAHWRDKL